MAVKKPRGTNDFYGEKAVMLRNVEEKIRKVCRSFRVKEIVTPMFEYTELFERGVGETTDIVQKEMFTFEDRGGRSLTLKPEGTAGAARAFIENGMSSLPMPVKLFYIAPCFRNERPQAGRYKQFHQFGVEVYGCEDVRADAETIALAHNVIKDLGLKNIKLKINSLGCSECRKKYNDTLKSFVGERIDSLCEDCKQRFEKNPLRVLDCKNEKCKEVLAQAPCILDCLDEECTQHFEALKKHLDNLGIDYIVDKTIVRGLDYYTRTVFEFVSEDIGAQGTVCGGGRYDNLVKECGGQDTPAVGFAMGLERIMLLLEQQESTEEEGADVYIASIGEEGEMYAEKLCGQLRAEGIAAECDIVGRSLKAQMKYADKIKAVYSLVIGDDDIKNDSVVLKNMQDGEKVDIKLSETVNEILNRTRR
ncbi:MAG: histidine--tRNA ligase [Firmicutes bacterium]|nr:histidine--tRNA ligase [Bacillota bacterium]